MKNAPRPNRGSIFESRLGAVAVKMIFILFFDHPRSTFRTGAINTALPGYMHFFMPTTRADTVSARTRARPVSATLAAPTSPSTCLSASPLTAATAKVSIVHKIISFFSKRCIGSQSAHATHRFMNQLFCTKLFNALLDRIELRFQPICLGF